MCGTGETEGLLTAEGLAVSVAARTVIPMTKLLQERASTLAGVGPWGPGQGSYEMVVVRGKARVVAAGAGRGH